MSVFWIPFFVIALDQLTKRMASYWHDNGLICGYKFIFFIQNKFVWNSGISFGLFSESYYSVLIHVAIAISVILVCVAWQRTKNKLDSIAWGLIVGGGISNAWDRWFFGAVLDFIEVSFDNLYFPIFNFADVFITIGGLILFSKFFRKNKKNLTKN